MGRKKRPLELLATLMFMGSCEVRLFRGINVVKYSSNKHAESFIALIFRIM
jgi:hypothetical protein